MITKYKMFEHTDIKKYWVIDTDDKLYKSALLDKIGMPPNNYWYDFVMRNRLIIVTYDSKINIRDRFAEDHWGTNFEFEIEDIKKDGFVEQELPNITKEDIEQQKLKKFSRKYNI